MKLKGYIFSRPFLGERAPQHIQNIVLKDYCNKKKFFFFMSATEYSIEKSTYILNDLLNNINDYDGLIFYSIFQLPEDLEQRSKFYKNIIKKNKQVHFAVENFAAKNIKNFQEIEKVFRLKILSYSNNRSISEKIGKLKNFVTFRHKQTRRNYLERMMNEKVYCMRVAKKYDRSYWDGLRKFGYGGYTYIPNYHTYLAKKLINNYGLNENSKILDVGCGKGFLIYELKKILKNAEILGCDISNYAKINSKKEIKNNIFIHDVKKKFNYDDNYFDLVLSINVLHNLKLHELDQALKEINRLGKSKFICVESYRNELEQFNLQCWALTAETIIDTKSWKWLFKKAGYFGDYEFIYFY
jgi:sporadic carbohydrate cluster protein (TIGR04323 family)